MNHVLLGFALCAALLIYPGGLAAAAAALLAALARPERVRGDVLHSLQRPGRPCLGLLFGSLLLVPVPWPDNPVAPLTVSWALGGSLGNVALSLGAIWGLVLVREGAGRRGLALALVGGWSLGLLFLALSVGSGGFSGVLQARGEGAEVGRLLVGVGLLACLPLLLGGPPGGLGVRGLGWAAAAGVALLLCLPQLTGLPFWAALLGWWGLSSGLGGAGVLVARLWPSLQGALERFAAAATLNGP